MDVVYRVNGPRVIFENIDGELILVNMEKGCYYSTDQVGADVWALIEAGHSVSEIHDSLRFRYSGEPHDITAALEAFLARLREEELVVPEDEPADRKVPNLATLDHRPDFHAPALEKYTDMRDMLLLDPVHDVEAAGWPVPKVEEAWPEPPAR